MDIKVKAKHIRISPKKVRLVIDLVRGLEVKKALTQLKFTNKKATEPVRKLIESAVANATNTYELDINNLFVKEVKVDEGKTLKRWMPRAHGRATTIRKRMSHISLVLGELKDSGKVKAKEVKIEAPVNLDDLAKKAQEESKIKNKDIKKDNDKSISVKSTGVVKDDKDEKKYSSNPKKDDGNKKGFINKIFRRKAG